MKYLFFIDNKGVTRVFPVLCPKSLDACGMMLIVEEISMKRILALLVPFLFAGMLFAQTPNPTPVEEVDQTATAPQLSTDQQLDITTMLLGYQTLTMQLKTAQQTVTDTQKSIADIQTKYKAFAAGLCQSTSKDKFVVDFGDPIKGTKPSCKPDKPATPSPDKQ